MTEKKKKYTIEDVKKMTRSVKVVEASPFYEDSFGNMHNINEDIEVAEKQIEEMKRRSINLNMRWYDTELKRCKKIAEIKGLKYQSYIKSVLKQAMDKDERELGLT